MSVVGVTDSARTSLAFAETLTVSFTPAISS